MKIIKNYKGGSLSEKVCKVIFKYKGSKTILLTSDNDWSLNDTLKIMDKIDEIEITGMIEYILEQLNSFDEKFKKGLEISDFEKQSFGLSVYFLTKIGFIKDDMDNGMVVFVK